MNESNLTRRTLLAATAAIPLASIAAASEDLQSAQPKDINMPSRTFTRTPAPDWPLAFWREIDDKTWGKALTLTLVATLTKVARFSQTMDVDCQSRIEGAR